MKFLRLLRVNLSSLLTTKNFIIIITIFMIHHFFSINLYGYYEGYSIINTLILFYYGPYNVNVEFLKWLLHQVPVIVMVGFFINTEFKERTIYILPRAGSVYLWLTGIILSCFILILIYYMIGLLVSIFLIYLFSASTATNIHILDMVHLLNEYGTLDLVMHQFSLLLLSTFAIVLINTLMTIIIKSSTASFFIIVSMIFLSVSLGHFSPEIIKWLPPAQGMLVKHDVNHFSFQWSYSYTLIVIIISTFLIHILSKWHLEELLAEENI